MVTACPYQPNGLYKVIALFSGSTPQHFVLHGYKILLALLHKAMPIDLDCALCTCSRIHHEDVTFHSTCTYMYMYNFSPPLHSQLDGEHVAEPGLAHGVGRPLSPDIADPDVGVGSVHLNPAQGGLRPFRQGYRLPT